MSGIERERDNDGGAVSGEQASSLCVYTGVVRRGPLASTRHKIGRYCLRYPNPHEEYETGRVTRTPRIEGWIVIYDH